MRSTRTTPRHRKLAMWDALCPYLGGKRRLASTIFREVDRILPRRHWPGLTFLDGFLGGGSVSLYAKAQGFKVVSTDIAARAIVIGQALIENSRVRLTHEDVLRLAKDDGAAPGRVETDYSPSTFTQTQARFLDRALRVADSTLDTAKAALIRLLAVRVALLCHPMSQVRTGTAHRVTTQEFEAITPSCVRHYVDAMRLPRVDRLWRLAEAINGGVFAGEGRVLQQSVFDALPNIEAAAFYADPPYEQVMSYEKEYRIIDEMLEGTSRPTSPFTVKGGNNMIDLLLEHSQHVPIWLLSFGNAAVGIDELEAKMTRLGRQTRAIEIAFQHLPAVATAEKKATNKEFLVVGWDECAVERIAASGADRQMTRAVSPQAVKRQESALQSAERSIAASGADVHVTTPVSKQAAKRRKAATSASPGSRTPNREGARSDA